MLWHVHSCFMLMCDTCVCSQTAMPHVKGSETCDCDRISSIRIQLFLSHPGFFWLQSWASAVMPCRDMEGCMLGSYVTWAGPWWTRFYYTGPVSQTASQSASFRKKAWREWRHTLREGARLNRGKTSIPSSQSQSTEPLKWCRISQEACRVELGAGGPNVALATKKSVPVNYHKWHDDLENCYWTL